MPLTRAISFFIWLWNILFGGWSPEKNIDLKFSSWLLSIQTFTVGCWKAWKKQDYVHDWNICNCRSARQENTSRSLAALLCGLHFSTTKDGYHYWLKRQLFGFFHQVQTGNFSHYQRNDGLGSSILRRPDASFFAHWAILVKDLQLGV